MSKEALRIVIQPYNGDPDLLDFFIEQVNTKFKGAKTSESHVLTFIKSKLSDKALKFYAQSIPCQRATTPTELFEIFRKNFRGETAQNIAIQYNSLKFNGIENIRQFANRLQNLAFKRFPKLSQDAIGQLLTAKLMDTLPANFKLHLLSQKTENFEQIVDALSTFQEILQSTEFSAVMQPSSQLQSHTAVNFNNISAENAPEVDHLSQCGSNVALNHVKIPNVNNCQQSLGQEEQNRLNADVRTQCQWCNRRGHAAQQCYTLKHLHNSKSNYRPKRLQRQSRQFKKNRDNSSNSFSSHSTHQARQSSFKRPGEGHTRRSRQWRNED